MRWIQAVLIVLLLASQSIGQVTIGGAITPEELRKAREAEAQAKAIINAANGIKLQLEVDQFEAVTPDKSKPTTSPLLWITDNPDTVERIEIDAGTPFLIRAVRAGDTVKKTHYFSPQPFRWAILIGAKQGSSNLFAAQNGADAKTAPTIYGQVQITVGPPVPPTPPPDPNDELFKAAKSDILSGKGTVDDVKFYREYLRAASPMPYIGKIGTEFWRTFHAGLVTKFGEATTGKLPAMRRAIADVFNRELADVQITTLDAAAVAKITQSLNAVAARLDLVK